MYAWLALAWACALNESRDAAGIVFQPVIGASSLQGRANPRYEAEQARDSLH
jgi:hypothetical protein